MNDVDRPSWIVKIPTPIWLILLVVIALLVGWAFELPAVLQHRPAGIALIVLGLAFSAWGWATFFERGAEIHPWSESHSTLVAIGPYRISRNPMYLGMVVTGIGAAFVGGTWAMWLVPVVLFQLATAPLSAHRVGRQAYRTGTIDESGLFVDELAESRRTPPAAGG